MPFIRSILRDLYQREIGFGSKNILRLDEKIIRKIVCHAGVTFKKFWKLNNKHSRIYFESGRIYYNNYRQCLILFGHRGYPRSLYNISRENQNHKIVDCLYCHSSITSSRAKGEAFRSCLLALTDDNWLLSIDLETGKIFQKIYLSKVIRFRHISWELDHHTVALKSSSNTNRTSSQFSIIIFETFPFKIKVHFQINKKIFVVDDLKNVEVMDGLLFVETHCTISIYSLQTIIDNNVQFELQVGNYSNGIPVNVNIEECPPLLFSVKCSSNRYFVIDGHPWQYITQVGKNGNAFQVFTLDQSYSIENGLLKYNYDTGNEPEMVTFHSDDSGRIIHSSATEYRFLKLVQIGGVNNIRDKSQVYKLQTLFTISFKQSSEVQSELKFSSFGRKITKSSIAKNANSTYKHAIVGFHYEDDLDLLALLVVNHTSSDSDTEQGSVFIYDNITGVRLKKIQLVHEWHEDDNHTFVFDVDIIVHIIKSTHRGSSNTIYIYKLKRESED